MVGFHAVIDGSDIAHSERLRQTFTASPGEVDRSLPAQVTR
jgi:hypothetical protein